MRSKSCDRCMWLDPLQRIRIRMLHSTGSTATATAGHAVRCIASTARRSLAAASASDISFRACIAYGRQVRTPYPAFARGDVLHEATFSGLCGRVGPAHCVLLGDRAACRVPLCLLTTPRYGSALPRSYVSQPRTLALPPSRFASAVAHQRGRTCCLMGMPVLHRPVRARA